MQGVSINSTQLFHSIKNQSTNHDTKEVTEEKEELLSINLDEIPNSNPDMNYGKYFKQLLGKTPTF